jgi:hypothetical protein
LAALSGHGEPPKVTVTKAAGGRKTTKGDPAKLKKSASTPVVKTDVPATSNGNGSGSGVDRGDVGLTVRIEINLPASGDQETYDRIFKIRENLLRG